MKRSFVSRADGVLVCRIECETPFDAEILLATRPSGMESWDPGHTSPGYVPKGAFVAHGIRAVESSASDNELVYRAAYAHTGGGYQGIACVTTQGDGVKCHGVAIRASETTSVDIVVALEPMADYEAGSPDDLRRRVEGCTGEYHQMLSRSARLHGALFDRVRLHLGDDRDHQETPAVEDLICEAQQNAPSPRYINLLFDACRYNILCSSGDLPPNLQGVWTGTWTPHWSGDFTLDANVQAAVAHYLSCGTPELMTSLFDLMDRMLPDFRENARALYGARGIFINSRVSTTGLQQRYNTCPMYFWTAGGAWIAHYYFDYYLYTLDEDFLRDRALPFMLEAVVFFEDFLELGADGHYEFNPSVSPENCPANSDSLVTLNATMDAAALRELLRNLLFVSTRVEIDPSRLDRWREMLDRLPPYAANDDGALKEWLTDALVDNYEHRHMSHLYPLYPGDEADRDETPELHDMVLQAFRKRMEHFNPKEYGGFGLYHVAMAAARAGDAETAWDAVEHMAQWHVYSGMSTSHNHGPTIVNMDASGGVPAALVEMLVVSRAGKVRLLPALPKALSVGSIIGVCCRGGIVIDRLEWNIPGRSVVAVLRADTDQHVEVTLPTLESTPTIHVSDESCVVQRSGDSIWLTLSAGTPLSLRVSWE
jgi:alpha-L-fucosidase 2